MEGWLETQSGETKKQIERVGASAFCFRSISSPFLQIEKLKFKILHSCCGLWIPVYSSAFCCFSAVAHNCDNHNNCIIWSDEVGYMVTVAIDFPIWLVMRLPLSSIFPYGRLYGYSYHQFFHLVGYSGLVSSNFLKWLLWLQSSHCIYDYKP